ncbi:MAG: hypothetical protein SV253_06890 [Halobacteria archaeon]|nr:hypothetical protein [Halobacteria archaeon]
MSRSGSNSDTEAKIDELEKAVESLAREMVDVKERLNEMEESDKAEIDREEIGVSADEDDDGGDDIYVA